MAKSMLRKGHAAGTVELNMVPMVDVIFVLVLFFILTGQIVSANFAALELASPTSSVAVKGEKKVPNQVIVSITCEVNPNNQTAPPEVTLKAKEYAVDETKFALGEDERLTKELKRKYAMGAQAGYQKDYFVEIRADKRVSYQYIEPVMRCAAEAGIPKMRITAMESK